MKACGLVWAELGVVILVGVGHAALRTCLPTRCDRCLPDPGAAAAESPRVRGFTPASMDR